MRSDFAVFILTHGRPDNVITFDTLKTCGYTGALFLVIDNEDSRADEYYSRFGESHVIMFDKKAVSERVDEFVNFGDRRAIVYARNACFDIAKERGYTYFLQLDDDYTAFDFRIFHDQKADVKKVKNLDRLFASTLRYYESIDAVTIAYAQGGDFIGGIDNGKEQFRFSKRKAMNTFFCSVDRPFQFLGRINEDVNAYILLGSQGKVFLTFQNASITQKQTQASKGGMSDIYSELGTYIKSFYTVICSPSSVCVRLMNASNKRLHHSIDWEIAVPKIISYRFKKSEVRP